MAELVAVKRGIRRIDPHVHFRDFNQSRVFTINEGMALARTQGVVAVGDMPNTDPPITNQEILDLRFKTAKDQGIRSGYYVWIGATSDPEQLRWAFREATNNPNALGIKLYAGISTGSLAVVELEKQRSIYKIAHEEKYRGVMAVHCEEETFSCPHNWDPSRPSTWNQAKPPIMEIVGISNQIMFAVQERFEGQLHIAHISTPQGVDMVNLARRFLDITCGATPHHLTLHDITNLEYKVNPPIRTEEMQNELLKGLEYGRIDWIETDFAPHPPKILDPTKPMSEQKIPSGIRSLNDYDAFLNSLATKHGFSPDKIEKLTYRNIKGVLRKIVE